MSSITESLWNLRPYDLTSWYVYILSKIFKVEKYNWETEKYEKYLKIGEGGKEIQLLFAIIYIMVNVVFFNLFSICYTYFWLCMNDIKGTHELIAYLYNYSFLFIRMCLCK